MPSTYVEAFMTKKPKEGITIVEERLKNAMALDIELAEYFKERAQIEELYAKNLSKASKRLYTMDPGVLGYFAPVWESLLKEFNQIANYHSDMAYQITQNIERPLRTSPSEDYHKLQQYEHLINSSTAGSKNKLSNVKGSIFRKSKNSSNSSLQNDMANYLALHQRIDEARLTRLKSMVELFEKIQSEQLSKRIEMSNMTLSSAQAFDTQHDIQDFCNERGKGLITSNYHATTNPIKSAAGDENPVNNSNPAAMRQRSSTMGSQDSHRSTNKFKSIFVKKKKSHSFDNFSEENRHSTYSDVTEEVIHAPENHTTIDSMTPMNHNNSTSPPLVDAEGYSIPTYTNNFSNIASDISSHNASDDVDSDLQSLKLNQRLQINIKENVVKEEENEANESFNKMATMLRARTPTVSKRPRGRRESSINRSQTDSTLFTSSPSIQHHTLDNPRATSMISVSSNETNSSNPFITSSSSPTNNNFNAVFGVSSSPTSSLGGTITLSNSPSAIHTGWPLQSIPEVQQQPQQQYLSVFIKEKTTLTAPDLLHVSGQILISYRGTQASFSPKLPIQLHHIDGIRQLTPNPEYVTTENGIYMLNINSFVQSNEEEEESAPLVCFTYELNSSPLALPIYLSPSWKCVEDVSYLMIKHAKNLLVTDASKLHGTVQVMMGNEPVIQHVQSTPQGLWDVKKYRLTWQLSELFNQYVQDESEEQQKRLLAKFYTEGKGSPRPIHLQYSLKDSLVSGISVLCKAIEIRHLKTMVQSEDHIVYM
ncbi:MAG: Muniscin C-terminal mu homology domain-containing protein [Benjaminiella poitrasii]|nr:MAG: Muniscin C-terminal mu homology domain-containing protein [Benjaminiella poitrasii]